MRQRAPLSFRSCFPGLVLVSLSFVSACDGGSGPGSDDIASLTVVSAPAASLTGAQLPQPAVIELRSAGGEPAAVEGIEVTASVTLGQLRGTTVVRTNPEGRAVFSGLTISGEDPETILRFTCCGNPAATHPISLLQSFSLLSRASPTTIEGRAGTEVAPGPGVRLIDERLSPVAGQAITFTLLQGGSFPLGTVTTDASGMAILPSLPFHDLPGQGRIFATVAGTGRSVWFDVRSTASGSVDLLEVEHHLVAPTGSAFVLPAVRVTDGGPVAGVEVQYRVISGSATMSVGSVLTDADGESAPISANLARGKSTVEIVAPGYSQSPRYVDVVGVSGPVTLSGVVTEYWGPILPPVFDWELDEAAYAVVTASDAEGTLEGFPLELIEIGEAGRFTTYYGIELVAGMTIRSNEWITWEIPAGAGTYEMQVTGPMVATPLVFKATRP